MEWYELSNARKLVVWGIAKTLCPSMKPLTRVHVASVLGRVRWARALFGAQ